MRVQNNTKKLQLLRLLARDKLPPIDSNLRLINAPLNIRVIRYEKTSGCDALLLLDSVFSIVFSEKQIAINFIQDPFNTTNIVCC